jgi:hypothetical protein
LLGPDGRPIQASYEIPFVRIFPSGTRGLQTIDRGEAMYALACRFIAAGGRFGIYIDTDGSVDMVALMKTAQGDDGVAAQEITTNDHRLSAAVDRLIRNAVAEIPPETLQ